MTAQRYFVATDGRLLPPWRLLLFVVLSVACIFVVIIGAFPVLRVLEDITKIEGTAEGYGTTLGLLLAHWMTFKSYDRHASWSYVGLHREAAEPRPVFVGFLAGASPIALASLALASIGLLTFVRSPDGPWLLVTAQLVLFLLPAAFYEELLMRGYIFATLREWIGPIGAILLTSVVFGLLHFWNPDASVRSLGLVILAGVYLAAVLIVTRSLYAAWIAHWAWNWVMAALLHVPVSGLALSRPDYALVDSGPDWLTGGKWGPEGGAVAALTMVGGLVILYARGARLAGVRRPASTEQGVNESIKG